MPYQLRRTGCLRQIALGMKALFCWSSNFRLLFDQEHAEARTTDLVHGTGNSRTISETPWRGSLKSNLAV